MFHIRRATPFDYPVVGQLYDQVGALHSLNLPDIFRDGGKSVFPYEILVPYLEAGEGAVFVAELAGDVVGFVVVIVRSAPEIPVLQARRLGVIDAMGVAPQARGQGIGRALMEQAHAWVKAKGAPTVELNVYEFNEPAQQLYESLGYKTISRKMGLKL